MLPADLADTKEKYLPSNPLTWSSYVESVFRKAWTTRVDAAGVAGDLPAAISTSDMRAELLSDMDDDGQPIARSRWGAVLDDPMTMVRALLVLSKGRRPAIRAVAGRRALWVPAEVDETRDVDNLASAKNCDRVVEAARRAMRRHAVPAVSPRDVSAECVLDPALRVNGKDSVARLLGEAAREKIGGTNGVKGGPPPV